MTEEHSKRREFLPLVFIVNCFKKPLLIRFFFCINMYLEQRLSPGLVERPSIEVGHTRLTYRPVDCSSSRLMQDPLV